MLTLLPAERFEYFGSLCVMTKDCNPFGHCTLLISVLDHAKGKQARPQLLEAIGFYSRYMPVLGLKLIGPGKIKLEQAKFLVNKNGLYHKTFRITLDEVTQLSTAVNQERRQFINNDPIIILRHPITSSSQIRTPQTPEYICQYKPSGPYFNAFKGDNCKRYVLKKLASIGIDVSGLHGFFELPRLTSQLTSLKLTFDPTLPEQVYWDSPLLLSPRTKTLTLQEEQDQTLQQHILQLQENLMTTYGLFEARNQELYSQGRTVAEINDTTHKIALLRERFTKLVLYPNQCTIAAIKEYRCQLVVIIEDRINSLASQGKEYSFIGILKAHLCEIFYTICQSFQDNALNQQRNHANVIDYHIAAEALVKVTSPG